MITVDKVIIGFDRALKVVSASPVAGRATPSLSVCEMQLTNEERRRSAGLMRVNHVGEVCAQALYEAQSQFSKTEATRKQLQHAAKEEEDHLAWTSERLSELNSRPSLLNPIWYAGAYALGSGAAVAGDRWSLGFVVETERQVESHLTGHLEKLPANDLKSRAIVAQMALDEKQHGEAAGKLGAQRLPREVSYVMALAGRIMTTIAYYV